MKYYTTYSIRDTTGIYRVTDDGKVYRLQLRDWVLSDLYHNVKDIEIAVEKNELFEMNEDDVDRLLFAERL